MRHGSLSWLLSVLDARKTTRHEVGLESALLHATYLYDHATTTRASGQLGSRGPVQNQHIRTNRRATVRLDGA
ncbi:MAG: hypothetical protein C4296_01665 [Gemmataceae bacterium]